MESAKAYETWLRAQLGDDLVAGDLRTKHLRMAEATFPFLRATYWRWAETILDICPEFKGAPSVLGVGDLHLENFGTWRDVDGRLVWGVNDFDEAAEMPYPLDLVRLAASALLGCPHVGTARSIANNMLRGYQRGLENPRPITLDLDYAWLRDLVVVPNPERVHFWAKMEALKPYQAAAEAIREGACKRDAGGQPQDVVQPAHRRLGKPRPPALCRARELAGRAGGARGEGGVAVGLVARQRRRERAQLLQDCHRQLSRARSLVCAQRRHRRAPPVAEQPQARCRDAIRSSSSAGDTCARWGAKSPPSTLGMATPAAAIKRDLEGRDPDWLASAATRAANFVRREQKEWRKEWRRAPRTTK